MAGVSRTGLSDDQRGVVEPLLPPAKHGGRPRTADLRLVVNTIFYLVKSGCQWAMLPRDLARRSTAHDYFAAWRRDGTWQAVMDALPRQGPAPPGPAAEPPEAAVGPPAGQGGAAGGAA